LCPNTNKYLLPDLLISGVAGGGLCRVIVVVVVRDTDIGVIGILLAGDASLSSPPMSTPPERHADSKKKKSLRSWYKSKKKVNEKYIENELFI
jgi:hypothetical protein